MYTPTPLHQHVVPTLGDTTENVKSGISESMAIKIQVAPMIIEYGATLLCSFLCFSFLTLAGSRLGASLYGYNYLKSKELIIPSALLNHKLTCFLRICRRCCLLLSDHMSQRGVVL